MAHQKRKLLALNGTRPRSPRLPAHTQAHPHEHASTAMSISSRALCESPLQWKNVFTPDRAVPHAQSPPFFLSRASAQRGRCATLAWYLQGPPLTLLTTRFRTVPLSLPAPRRCTEAPEDPASTELVGQGGRRNGEGSS